MYGFTAPLYRLGRNFCVDAPVAVSVALGDGTFIQVAGRANGATFSTTLVPRGGGAHRLFLDGAARRAAATAEGESVAVELRRDGPDPPLPEELTDALQRNEGTPEAFALLPPGLRREMIRYVTDAKREATRVARIEQAIDELRRRA